MKNDNKKEWKLKVTPNVNAINDLCNDAQENSRYMAAIGKTGLGKTEALKQYAKKNANTYYMLCTITMGRKDFLSSLAEAIGLQVEGSIHHRVDRIVEHLSQQRLPLILIDDVGKLPDSCFRLIQVIYDRLKDECGMVIAGLPEFKRYVDKMAAKDKAGFPEQKRRIEYWMPLMGVPVDFVKTVCSEYEITDPACIQYIYNNSPDYGTLSNIMVNYSRAALKATKSNKDISQMALLSSLTIGDRLFKN